MNSRIILKARKAYASIKELKLMLKIRDIIASNGWSQREAAKILGVSQPRVAEINSFNTAYFSVDLLLKYLGRLGTKVTFRFKKIDAA